MNQGDLVNLLKDSTVRKLAMQDYVLHILSRGTKRNYCLVNHWANIDPLKPYTSIDKPKDAEEFINQFLLAFENSYSAKDFSKTTQAKKFKADVEIWLPKHLLEIKGKINAGKISLEEFYAIFWQDVDLTTAPFKQKQEYIAKPQTEEEQLQVFRMSFQRFNGMGIKTATLFTKYVVYYLNLFSDKEKYLKYLEVPNDLHVQRVVKHVWNTDPENSYKKPDFESIQKCAKNLSTEEPALLPIDLDLIMPLRLMSPESLRKQGVSEYIISLHHKLCDIPPIPDKPKGA